MKKPAGIDLQVSDVSAQKLANVKNVPSDATVGEVVEEFLTSLKLPKHDNEGRPLNYAARRKRDGVHINSSARVGEAFVSGDAVVLQPNVDAA